LIVEGTKHVFILRYTETATACFVAYEYLINLDYEVRFLWPRRFNFGFLLLFLCRYLQIGNACVAMYTYVLTSDIRTSNCSTLMKTNAALVYCQLCLSCIVLFTRAYAVWGSRKRMYWFLLCTCIVALAPTMYTLNLYLRGVSFPGLRIWNGCIYLIVDHNANFYSMIGIVVMDSLALSLLLYKSVQHARFMKSLSGGSERASILSVMAQDGITYFVMNLACTIANMIGVKRFPAYLHGFLIGTQACMQNVLCARLYFHIQIVNENWTTNVTSLGAAAGQKNNSTPMEMNSVGGRRGALSKIKFAEISAIGMETDVQESTTDGVNVVEETRSTTEEPARGV